MNGHKMNRFCALATGYADVALARCNPFAFVGKYAHGRKILSVNASHWFALPSIFVNLAVHVVPRSGNKQ